MIYLFFYMNFIYFYTLLYFHQLLFTYNHLTNIMDQGTALAPTPQNTYPQQGAQA